MSGNAKQRRKARRAVARAEAAALFGLPPLAGDFDVETPRSVAVPVSLEEWRGAREVEVVEPQWSWPMFGGAVAFVVALAAFVAWLYTLPFGAR